MEPGQAVMIGDVLAISEELLPGPGTFDDGTHIRAARLGVFQIDHDEFAATVAPATKIPVELGPDDIVVGEVYIVKESMVGIGVKARVGNEDRNISGSTDGTLHVAKTADRYIHSLEDHFKKGDIVRARVLSARPSLQLTTQGRALGVIKARCTRCRNDLVIVDQRLVCSVCEHHEFRHVAADYGRGHIGPIEEELRDLDLREPPREQRDFGPRGPMTRRGSGRSDRREGGRGGDRRGGGFGRGRGGDRREGGERREGGGRREGGSERREGGGRGRGRGRGRGGGRPGGRPEGRREGGERREGGGRGGGRGPPRRRSPE